MNKIITLVSIVVLIIFFVIMIMIISNNKMPGNPINVENNTKIEETQIQTREYNDFQVSKAEFLDDFYGVYGEYNYDFIQVLPGKDDDHVNISYFRYRLDFFEIKDFPIIKSKDGTITGNMVLPEESDITALFNNAEANLLIENYVLKLSFNKNVLMYPQDESKNTELEFQKTSGPILLEDSKQKALLEIVESNGKSFNSDILSVEKDTENYLVLKCDSYLYAGEDYYYLDDMDESDLTNYYNYNKKENKIVSLEDIAGTKMNDVNEYINTSIEGMKEEWKKGFFEGEKIEGDMEEWPYREFEGLGNVEYLNNYFLIDEENKIVRIRVLDYPNEALKALGDICIDVPFSCFEKVI